MGLQLPFLIKYCPLGAVTCYDNDILNNVETLGRDELCI
jgi:hypothetical protein